LQKSEKKTGVLHACRNFAKIGNYDQIMSATCPEIPKILTFFLLICREKQISAENPGIARK